MRPIRQRRTPKPLGEEVVEVEKPKGGSTVLVAAMLVFLGMGLLCLAGSFMMLILPDSRFQLDLPWFDTASSGLLGLSTIFMAMTLLMKMVIQLFERD